WRENNGGPNNIALCDLTTGITTWASASTQGQSEPAIFGDRIVWRENNGGPNNIALCDLTTGITTWASASTQWQDYPAIFGDRIVWMENNGVVSNIALYTDGTITFGATWNAIWPTCPTPDGTYTIQSYAYDQATHIANSSFPGATITVFVDTQKATVTVISALPTYVNPDGTVTIVFTYNDANPQTATVKIGTGGTTYGTDIYICTGTPGADEWATVTVQLDGLAPDGTMAVSVEVIDKAGNIGTDSKDLIVVDSTSPSCNIVLPWENEVMREFLWFGGAPGGPSCHIIHKIDPFTGNEFGTISYNPGLRPMPAYDDLAWDGRYLWASDCANDKLHKIDPITGATVTSLSVAGAYAGVAFDGEALWMARAGGPPTIYRIDPSSGATIRTLNLTVTNLPDGGLAWDGEAIWGAAPGATNYIYRIDPITGLILATITVTAWNPDAGLDYDGKYLWSGSNDGGNHIIHCLDTSGNEIGSWTISGISQLLGLAWAPQVTGTATDLYSGIDYVQYLFYDPINGTRTIGTVTFDTGAGAIGTYVVGFGSATIAGYEGPGSITMVVYDKAGNAATSSAVSCIIDRIAPAVEITTPTANSPAFITSTGSVCVTFSYTEQNPATATITVFGPYPGVSNIATQTVINLFGGAEKTAQGTVSIVSFPDGTYTVWIALQDRVYPDPTGTASQPGAVVIDTTLPQATITDANIDDTFATFTYTKRNGTITVSFSYTETNPATFTITIGTNTIWFSSNTTTFNNGTGTIALSYNIPDGTYTLWGTLTDKSGNSGTSTQIGWVIVDETAPVVELISPKFGAPFYTTKYGTVCVTFSYTEANPATATILIGTTTIDLIGSTTLALIQGGTVPNTQGTVTFTNAPDGSYTIWVVVRDKVDLFGTSSNGTSSVLVDSSSPKVGVILPLGTQTWVSTATPLQVQFTYSDENPASYTVRLGYGTDTSPFTPAIGSGTLTAKEGTITLNVTIPGAGVYEATYTLYVIVEDTLANLGTGTTGAGTLWMDLTKPQQYANPTGGFNIQIDAGTVDPANPATWDDFEEPNFNTNLSRNSAMRIWGVAADTSGIFSSAPAKVVV
ncbi:Ig-like domain repeat protein, partial [Patescibacteria group bacterium]|nr:Ig-like domain repeat protein [Patescibacteria group bacterium]